MASGSIESISPHLVFRDTQFFRGNFTFTLYFGPTRPAHTIQKEKASRADTLEANIPVSQSAGDKARKPGCWCWHWARLPWAPTGRKLCNPRAVPHLLYTACRSALIVLRVPAVNGGPATMQDTTGAQAGSRVQVGRGHALVHIGLCPRPPPVRHAGLSSAGNADTLIQIHMGDH